MMWWNQGPGWGGWLTMTLIMVAFWSLGIAAVVTLWRSEHDGGRTDVPRDHDPLAILDGRFAHGEIDAAEYSARRGTLLGAVDR